MRRAETGTRGVRPAGRQLVRRSLRLVESSRGDTLGDYPPNYAAWASSVKANGGAAVVWPPQVAPTENGGKPAARYDVATYGTLFNAGKIDATASQTAYNGFVYVLAPADVIAAAPALQAVTSQEEAGLEKGFWEKLGLPDLSQYARYAVYGAGGLVILWLVFKLIPSPRHNPPRRRPRRSTRARTSRSS